VIRLRLSPDSTRARLTLRWSSAKLSSSRLAECSGGSDDEGGAADNSGDYPTSSLTRSLKKTLHRPPSRGVSVRDLVNPTLFKLDRP
jgi:hypothetical protein